MTLDWAEVAGFAARLAGARRSTYHGRPAIKANVNAFLAPGREQSSSCLMIGRDTVDMPKEIAAERIFAMIERTHGQAMTKTLPTEKA